MPEQKGFGSFIRPNYPELWKQNLYIRDGASWIQKNEFIVLPVHAFTLRWYSESYVHSYQISAVTPVNNHHFARIGYVDQVSGRFGYVFSKS